MSSLTPRLRLKLARLRRSEDGFSLPELLIVVAISSAIALALASAFIVGIKTTAEAQTRLQESHDAQLLATYFGGDVGSVAPNGISTTPPSGRCLSDPLRSNGGAAKLRLPGTTVVRLHWTEDGNGRDAWYVQPEIQQDDGTWARSTELVRRYCEDDSAAVSQVRSEVRVVKHMRQATLYCPPSGPCTGSPNRVELTIEELSGFDYTLRALPRSTTAAQLVGVAPRVISINRVPDKEFTNAASVKWDVKFNDEVTGVSADDFNLVHTLGGTTPSLTVSPGFPERLTRTWTVTANTSSSQVSGTLRLDLFVDDESIRDQDRTKLDDWTFTGQTYTIDKVAPTVNLVRAPDQPISTKNLPIRFNATFSEPVDFDAADVVCVGCTGGTLVVNGTGPAYEIVIDGIAAGTVSVSIPAGQVKDPAGNGNAASAVPAVHYDPLLVVVQSIDRYTGDPNPTNAPAGTLRWLVTFSAAVRNVDAADFDLYDTMNGSAAISSASISSVTPATTTLATSWTVTANVAGISKAGNLWLELDDNDTIRTGPGSTEGSYLGGFGQSGPGDATFTGQAYSLDRERPVATVARAAGQLPTATSLPLRFSVTFNEPVVGFQAADVTRTGAAASATVTVTATGDRSYDLSLQGAAVGTSTVSIAASGVQDALGNNNLVSNTASVYYNPSMLRVVSINRLDPENTDASSVRWQVTFSQAVRSVSASDFDLVWAMGGNPSISSMSPSDSNTLSATWTVTANISGLTGTGPLRLDLDDDNSIRTAADIRLGDPAVANDGDFAGQTYTIDRPVPTITSLELKNRIGGIAGKIEQGDMIVVTFSQRMRVSSFCDDWSNDMANQILDGNNDVTVDIDSNDADGNDNEITIRTDTDDACAFQFGAIDLDDDDYIDEDSTFHGSGVDKSTIQWDATNFRLTITLGEADDDDDETQVETGTHEPIYDPDGDIRSLNGLSIADSFRLPDGVQF